MSKARILIVEDEQITALDLKQALQAEGYEVIGIATSGESAVAQAHQHQPDLIIMDIRINGPLDGVTTAAQIRSSQSTPLVFLTAHADADTLKRARVVEPNGYIVKPYQPQELRAVVEVALYNHRRSLERGGAAAPVHSPGQRQVVSEISGEQRKDTQALAILNSIKLLSPLSPAKIELLAAESRFRNLQAHEHFFQEGDNAPPPFVVLSGRIAMIKASPNGKEMFADIIGAGDWFGLITVIDELPSQFTARAQNASRVLYLPRNLLALLFRESSAFQEEMTRYVSYRLRLLQEFARALAHDRVEQRLAALLLSLAKRASPSKEQIRDISLQITRQELASLAGCTTETTIRVTKEFENSSVVDLSDRGYIRIINLDSLLRLSQGETQVSQAP